MDSDQEDRRGRVPLGGRKEPAAPPPGPAVAREAGLRQVRRMSAWSAAALIVGTGAATAALAHSYATPAQPAATAPAAAGTGGQAAAPGAAAQGTGGPAVTHSVATTSGSGVTTTTTRTVGGKTIVTQVRHPGAYHDN